MTLSSISKLSSASSLVTAIGYMLFAIGINSDVRTKENIAVSGRWIIFIGTFLLYALNIISISQNENKDAVIIESPDLLILAGSFMIASGAFVAAVGFEKKNLKEAHVY
ncbi:hypothetical protein [Thermoanaerobacterium sp. R66]|uniref:hypothetical protein n=1 Tax=Thermoanaerobacterium sp. R66 TaxID=2742479 RepID=UPI0023807DAB|nr:hypothetical protein [Thermoanaerobacterium sp. R66]MDE4542325.1 hypothetical protein [Thermoanaerobacterium sp. R66]